MSAAVLTFYRFRLVWLALRLLISRCWRQLPLRSSARSDRSGAQIHDDLMAASFCFRRGLRWGGSVGSAHFQDHLRLSTLLGLPVPRQRGWRSLIDSYYREQIPGSGEAGVFHYRTGVLKTLDSLLGLRLLPPAFSLQAETIFTPPFVSHLRATCPLARTSYMGYRVVIHIRRGDVSDRLHPLRYTANGVYLQLLDEIERLLGSAVHVTIHSQAKSVESFDCFLARGAVLKLDTCIEEAWRDMITADILVMSKSSFSYVPAIYNTSIVLYQPFWHGCLPWWINVSASYWRDAFLSAHRRLSSGSLNPVWFS